MNMIVDLRYILSSDPVQHLCLRVEMAAIDDSSLIVKAVAWPLILNYAVINDRKVRCDVLLSIFPSDPRTLGLLTSRKVSSLIPNRTYWGWWRVFSSALLSSSTLLFIWIRLSPRGLLNIQYGKKAWAKKINRVWGKLRHKVWQRSALCFQIFVLVFLSACFIVDLQQDDFILVSLFDWAFW